MVPHVKGVGGGNRKPAGLDVAGDRNQVGGDYLAILKPNRGELTWAVGAIIRRVENIGDVADIVHAGRVRELTADEGVGD